MSVVKKNVKRCTEYCVHAGSLVVCICTVDDILVLQLEDIRVSENVKVLMESFNQCLCTLIVDLQACCLCLACNFHS